MISEKILSNNFGNNVQKNSFDVGQDISNGRRAFEKPNQSNDSLCDICLTLQVYMYIFLIILITLFQRY